MALVPPDDEVRNPDKPFDGLPPSEAGFDAADGPMDDRDVPEEGREAGGAADDEPGPVLGPESPLAPADFLPAVRQAMAVNADPVEIRLILERVPADPALLEELAALMNDPSAARALQGYAAEALVRAGTPDSIQHVLDELLAAGLAGDADRTMLGMAALEAPTTTDGLRALFDLVLGRGGYAGLQGELPPEVLIAARKALLSHPDREMVGNMAVELYLDRNAMADETAMWELFDGVSHPVMLSKLAARAYAADLPDNAAQFMARLDESDEPGVVEAVVRMTASPSVPVVEAAETLYEWSRQHPDDAQPGLFMEYLSDSTLPPDQRSVAAFGLAGTMDPEHAREMLQKALENEADPTVRSDLQTALDLLATH